MGSRQMLFLFGVLLASILGEAGAQTCFAGNSTYPACGDGSCNGACDVQNPCQCTDGTPCVPTQSGECDRAPDDPTGCCPPGLYYNTTCCSEQLSCADPCLADEVCTSNNGVAKCICNQTLYRYANRSDIMANATCRTTVMRLEFSKCLLERFHFDYQNMHLLDDSINCSGLYFRDTVNNMRVIVTEPLIGAGNCGNIKTVNEGKVTYSNVLYIPPEILNGIIYSNPLNYTFSCTYNLTMQTSLSTVIHPVATTVVLPFGNGTGSANATMAAYTEPTYTTPYTTGYILKVGDRIYIGIFTDFADGETFALRAEICYASSSADGSNPVQLIVGGCAVDQGTSTLIESNGQSLEVRFSLDTFVFQDQSQVFMFCNVRLCQKGTNSSCTGCANGANGRAADGTVEMKVGPLDLQGTDSSGTHSAVSWTLLGSSLLALLSLKMM